MEATRAALCFLLFDGSAFAGSMYGRKREDALGEEEGTMTPIPSSGTVCLRLLGCLGALTFLEPGGRPRLLGWPEVLTLGDRSDPEVEDFWVLPGGRPRRFVGVSMDCADAGAIEGTLTTKEDPETPPAGVFRFPDSPVVVAPAPNCDKSVLPRVSACLSVDLEGVVADLLSPKDGILGGLMPLFGTVVTGICGCPSGRVRSDC